MLLRSGLPGSKVLLHIKQEPLEFLLHCFRAMLGIGRVHVIPGYVAAHDGLLELLHSYVKLVSELGDLSIELGDNI